MTKNDEEIERLLQDRAASNWLKNSLKAALPRDPMDAANDAEVLFSVLDRRAVEVRERFFGFSTE